MVMVFKMVVTLARPRAGPVLKLGKTSGSGWLLTPHWHNLSEWTPPTRQIMLIRQSGE